MKRNPIWTIILILLLLANLGWMWWNSSRHSGLRAAGKQFKIEMLHTNGASGVGIFEGKTEQPLWVEWDLDSDGKADQVNYFFQGKDVFDVSLSSNHPPKFSVYFRSSSADTTRRCRIRMHPPTVSRSREKRTWWIDDGGNGSFSERIYYNTNGNFYRREAWYNEAWQVVDRRNERNGIVINGAWRQLHLDTNTETSAPQ